MMRIKLSASEFNSLYNLFNKIVKPVKTETMEALCYYSLLMQVLDKMHRKGIQPRSHLLTLSQAEAIAFYLFRTEYKLPINLMFERVMLMQICNKIHQTYSPS